MSIDRYLDRTYDHENYNCLHFTCEVWKDLTGEDPRERLEALLDAFSGKQRLTRKAVTAFERLDQPVSPCIALMERFEPHVGLYIRQRILHLTERGVEFFPPYLAMRGFNSIRYYR